MTILELMAKRAQAWENAKKFFDEKISETGLSAEDQAAYDKMLEDIDKLTNTIKQLEEREKMDKTLDETTTEPIINNPANKDKDSKEAKAKEKKEFIKALRTGNFQNNLQTSPDEQGGYLIPETFWQEIIMKMDEINVMRRLCRVITTSNDINIPLEDTGATVGYVDEGALIPETDATFKRAKLSAYKIGALIRVTTELLQDSMFDIESYVRNEFAKKLAAFEEQEFINGDGSEGYISGLLTDPSLKTVTAKTAGTIVFDDVIDLIYTVPIQNRPGSSFLTSDSAVKMMRKLKDTTGQYIWSPSIIPGQPDKIYGYPLNVSTSYAAPEAGEKAMVFGDFKGYWIGDRLRPTIQRLVERYADYGQVGFIATERVDGKLINPDGLAALEINN